MCVFCTYVLTIPSWLCFTMRLNVQLHNIIWYHMTQITPINTCCERKLSQGTPVSQRAHRKRSKPRGNSEFTWSPIMHIFELWEEAREPMQAQAKHVSVLLRIRTRDLLTALTTVPPCHPIYWHVSAKVFCMLERFPWESPVIPSASFTSSCFAQRRGLVTCFTAAFCFSYIIMTTLQCQKRETINQLLYTWKMRSIRNNDIWFHHCLVSHFHWWYWLYLRLRVSIILGSVSAAKIVPTWMPCKIPIKSPLELSEGKWWHKDMWWRKNSFLF